MPRAAKQRTRRVGVLLAALVAGAAAAEASIPPPERWPSLLEEPAAALLAPPTLEDLAAELALPSTSPAPAAAAATGERFRLLEGLELGLTARSEPRFRLFPRPKTRVWAITLPEPVHIELELPLTPGRFRLYGHPPAGIAVDGTFLTTDPMGYADSPNLYQYGLNNPINFSDPLGLAVIEQADVRYVQDEIARERQEALQRLLASTEGYLLAHQGESEAQIRMGLAQHLKREGFVSGPTYEAHNLTVALLGPGQCDGSQHVVCHFKGTGKYARAMEFVVINASMLAMGELAAAELVAAGPSYAAMLETIQGEAAFGRALALAEARARLVGLLHKVELGTDPRAGYRVIEATVGSRLEAIVGALRRDPTSAFEWIGRGGRTYDAVAAPSEYFSLDAFTASIRRHLLKQSLDEVVVDVAGLTPQQAASVRQFVSQLTALERSRIRILQ